MSDRLVGDGEFTQVVSNHFRLDFDSVENFTVVNGDLGANHFRDDEHITEVGLNDGRLLIWRSLLLSLTKLLDETERTTLKTTLETSTSAGVNEVHELLNDMLANAL